MSILNCHFQVAGKAHGSGSHGLCASVSNIFLLLSTENCLLMTTLIPVRLIAELLSSWAAIQPALLNSQKKKCASPKRSANYHFITFIDFQNPIFSLPGSKPPSPSPPATGNQTAF